MPAIEAIDLSPIKRIEELRAEESRALIFNDEIGFFLRESEELVLQCELQTLLAEADQIDALTAIREFDFELQLIPLAESEGQILIDRGSTVTSELKRRAGDVRQRASAVRESLAAFQKTRRQL